MKSRILVIGFLSLLWVGLVQAATTLMDDMPEGIVGELRTLQTMHPLTRETPMGTQLDLLKRIPLYFKGLAAALIPFKEVVVDHYSPKTLVERQPFKELTEEELPPPSPVAAEPEFDPYSENEMILCIARLCYPAPAAHYESGIRALFASGKAPKHGAKQITEGLQCLGSKMLFARALVEMGLSEEIGQNLQMTAINQLMKFHTKTLAEVSPTLVSAIPTDIPGCPACLGLPRLAKH